MLGVMVIVDLIDRAIVFEAMYSQNGLIPIDMAREIYSRAFLSKSCFSLHMLHGNDYYQAALILIAACCALCVIVGYKLRFFLIVSWLLHLSIHARNPIYGSAADTTLGLILFWAIFLPLSDRLSIDRRQGKLTLPLGPTALHFGGACYLIQLVVMYVSAAYAKDYMWRDGGALMKVMHMDLLVSSFGRYLTNFPFLLSVLTLVAWWTEAIGTLLLFSPVKTAWTRGLCFLLFFGLHVGIAATCDIGLFPFFSMVFLLPVIPGAWWDFLGNVFSKQKNQTSIHPDRDRIHRRNCFYNVAGCQAGQRNQSCWQRHQQVSVHYKIQTELARFRSPRQNEPRRLVCYRRDAARWSKSRYPARQRASAI